ncbi:hypothetical protein [Novosphingobium sp. Chol11]|uniref:hypothetical protein n=1 Tax=Novosphingobium sp. Chol11 TaxID=1385763 RepID=UPI0025F2110C|nr:hypothetical protein [Novosphingobium sp. Chol11]
MALSVLAGSAAQAMAGFFASGRAADVVLAVIVFEFGWLVTAGRWRMADAALRLAPGALMLVALRAALSGWGWVWIAAPLLMSFPVHLADLARHKR